MYVYLKWRGERERVLYASLFNST